MKSTACFALLFFALVGRAEINLRRVIDSVELKDGRVLPHFLIVSYSEHALMAKWDGGRGTVDYDNLPDGLREAIVSSRVKAAANTYGQTQQFSSRPPQKMTATVVGKVNGILLLECHTGARPDRLSRQEMDAQTRLAANGAPPRAPVGGSVPRVGSYYEAPADTSLERVTGMVAVKDCPNFAQIGIRDPFNAVVVRVGDFQSEIYGAIPLFRVQ